MKKAYEYVLLTSVGTLLCGAIVLIEKAMKVISIAEAEEGGETEFTKDLKRDLVYLSRVTTANLDKCTKQCEILEPQALKIDKC
jgi:hypothetical protein